MKKVTYALIALLALFITPIRPAFAFGEEDINTSARAALLYDYKSGTEVYSKNADKRYPIASMSKLASLMLVFEAIDQGKLDEETYVKVSQHAADTKGSSAFLDKGSEYKVGDLVMTVIVCSANDSMVALAEAVKGSEDAFVNELNQRFEKLGLENTSFVNCTGLPAADHYSSARDVAKIYEQICEHRLYKKYSKIWMTELVHPSGRKTDIVNTNRLIKFYEGCDSGKTGFTNDAGYCLAASATRGGMRLIGVVMGEADSKTRFNDMASLFNYGFNNFENKVVISTKNAICEAEVKNSTTKSLFVYPKEDVVKFIKKGNEYKYSLEYKLNEIKAPVKVNDEVGQLFVLNESNIVTDQIPLVSHEDIKAKTFKEMFDKIINKI